MNDLNKAADPSKAAETNKEAFPLDSFRVHERVATLNTERMKEAEMKPAGKESPELPANDRDMTFTGETQTLVKEAIYSHLSRMNSDYYNIDAMPEIRGMLEVSNPHTWQEATGMAEKLSLAMMERVATDKPQLIKRYCIDDISTEAKDMSRDAMDKAREVISNTVNDMERMMALRVSEVNDMIREYNNMAKAVDPNYMFKDTIDAYTIRPKDITDRYCTEYTLIGKSVTDEYRSSWVNAETVMKKLDAIEQKMVMEYPQLLKPDEHGISMLLEDYLLRSGQQGREKFSIPSPENLHIMYGMFKLDTDGSREFYLKNRMGEYPVRQMGENARKELFSCILQEKMQSMQLDKPGKAAKTGKDREKNLSIREEMKKSGNMARLQESRLTDIHIFMPMGKEYYISAKLDGVRDVRMPITRKEAIELAEGKMDIRQMAEHCLRNAEVQEKKGNGLKR